MKRGLAVFFFIIIFYLQIGLSLLWVWGQKQVKKEIRQQFALQIPSDTLIILRLPYPFQPPGVSIIWTDKDEFKWQGRLYDLVKTEVKKDSIYFYCINDREEEYLLERLSRLMDAVHQEPGQEQEPEAALSDEDFRDYYWEPFNLARAPYKNPESHLFANARIEILNTHLEIPTPPPRF